MKNNNPKLLIVPPSLRHKARFEDGQELEFEASRGMITIVPKLVRMDDEYSPEQRRIVEARVAEGLANIKAGRTYGPFNTAAEMVAHMKAQQSKSRENKVKALN